MRTHHRHRGIALVFVLSLVVLIGIVFASIGMLFTAELRRTGNVQTGAQLQQMLVAGTATALEDATRWNAHPPSKDQAARPIPLPPELTEAGAALTWQIVSAEGERAQVEVVAKMDARHVEQTIRLSRTGETWQAIETAR